MTLLKFLFRHYKKSMLLAIFLGVVSGAVNAMLISAVSRGVASMERGLSGSLPTFAALVALMFLMGILTETVIVRLSTKITLAMRLNICHQILEANLRKFEEIGAARLMAVFTEDIPSLNGALLKIPALFVNFSIILGCFLYLGLLSPFILMILVGFLLLSATIYLLPEKMGMKLIQRSRDAWDRMMQEFSALMDGFKELKLHFARRESFYRDQLITSGDRVRDATFKHRVVYLVLRNLSSLLYFTFMGVLLFVLPSRQDMDLHTLAGFTIVGLYVYGPILTLIDAIPIFRRAGVSFRKIERNGLRLSVSSDDPYADSQRFKTHISTLPKLATLSMKSLRHTFYREREEKHFTLGPFDMTFNAGDLIFIIGGNGSGKTTFAKLLTGLYLPEAGEISVNGVAINEENVEVYRQFFSAIFSDFFVFEQIMGIDPNLLDARALTYLEQLHLDHKVSVEGGNLSTVELSSGQRKRLALLTAYLEDRQVYVFDEWAADQDPEFKEIFYRHLLPELRDRGKTVFVISHDDRYFDVADRLVKLADGKLESDETVKTAPRPVADHGAAVALHYRSGDVFMKRESAKERKKRSVWGRLAFGFLGFAAVLLVAVIGLLFYVRARMMNSLPRLDGELVIETLAAPVQLDRDAAGVPTLTGKNRRDLITATGFLHGQERFFQMDLLRRNASGELAELFGDAAMEADLERRLHRFKLRARACMQNLPPAQRAILVAYAEGVNAGLASLKDKPPEYLLLRTEPEPWLPDDAILVGYSMYLDLEDWESEYEAALGLMYEKLPEPVVAFLAPKGNAWDAPIDGSTIAEPAIPGAAVFDLRNRGASVSPLPMDRVEPKLPPGSNAWALADDRTGVSGALLANDMHLGIRIPNTWYRLCLKWPDETSGEGRRLVGVTLPGTPGLIVGSTGRIAWGFASNATDSADLVVLEPDPQDPQSYLTPVGPEKFGRFRETVTAAGGDSRSREYLETIWGPVVGEDVQGRKIALRWVAHDPAAINFRIMDLEEAATVAQAMDVANGCGAPAQSFIVADRNGSVGWSVIGLLPKRVGFDGRVPTTWHDGTRYWDGWYPPQEYPRIVDPAQGMVWAANTRTVGGEMLDKLGDPGYMIGARAGQIRDALAALENATTQDMLDLQLDDRALFLGTWRDLLLAGLDTRALEGHPKRATFRKLIEDDWSGRASLDSSGYRLVRTVRTLLFRRLMPALTEPCVAASPAFSFADINQHEAPLWRLLTERPAHFLPSQYPSWDDLILECVDEAIAYFEDAGFRDLRFATWGNRNVVPFRHPLSSAVPALGRWFDLSPVALPGDVFMPRLQNGTYGAVLRMVVTPGQEEKGIFHMPCGQSGHPFSPYFDAGHDDWVKGVASPLLPGETQYTLRLEPTRRAERHHKR